MKRQSYHSSNQKKRGPKKLWIALLLLLIVVNSLSLWAQKSPKDKFIYPPLNPIQVPQVEEIQLSNGLRVFLVEDHDFPTIEMRALIRTGSVFEPEDKLGLAAVTGEVLRTGGTKNLSGDEIDQVLEKLAASIETSIGQTSGYIYVSLMKDDLEKVLPILADILMNPAFSEEKIQLAKIKQKSYIARRNDDVGQITRREFAKLIYGSKSPYARHPEYATIESITREDIVNFYQKYFSPNNMILAVVGDFSLSHMKAQLEKTLGQWSAKKVKVGSFPAVKYNYVFRVNLIEKPDVNQSNIMLGHIGGLMNNPDYPALIIMNSILSLERMFKKIRTDEGLAYSVWGRYGARYVVPGIFSCGAQTKSESTVYAIKLMLRELKRITEEEVTDEELQRAKDQYLNGFVFNFDSKTKILSRILTYAYFGYPLDFMERLKKQVERVTKKDVLRVARKYLKPDKVQILVVGNPKDFDQPLDVLGEVSKIDITIPPPPKKQE
ncbi:insulinase family protein [Candidatus Aminicenantes bacterium AC-334-K16]|jgi:zinc protease|nr:insulinase family protein [Candidatus Aminicenantes bacterium AC-334-K16]